MQHGVNRNEKFFGNPVDSKVGWGFKPSSAKLNPICPLLVLFGAHHILHDSRMRFISCVMTTCSSHIVAV